MTMLLRWSDPFVHIITAFANGGGGDVIVTSPAHRKANGDSITISETTNYNGTFTVANSTPDTFTIVDTWVADDATGSFITASSYDAELSCDPESIVEQSKASKKVFPRTGDNPIIIGMGHEGPAFAIMFDIVGSVQYGYWHKIAVGTNLSIYDNGSLDEFVNTEVYYIDDLSINRKGGYLDRWKASLRIIRYISF